MALCVLALSPASGAADDAASAWVLTDMHGWTVCQLTWNFATKIMTSEFKNISTGHTTGLETSAELDPLAAALAFTRAGIINQGGNTSYIAQVWVGGADDAWPEGKLNGWGS